jgi:hypothetical protein
MKWNPIALLPLVSKLGEYLKEGFEHYVAMRASGTTLTTEALTMFLYMKLQSWAPTVNGKNLLDDETRQAAARFMAGVAINLAK